MKLNEVKKIYDRYVFLDDQYDWMNAIYHKVAYDADPLYGHLEPEHPVRWVWIQYEKEREKAEWKLESVVKELFPAMLDVIFALCSVDEHFVVGLLHETNYHFMRDMLKKVFDKRRDLEACADGISE